MITLNEIKKEINDFGVKVEERNMNLEELLNYASKNSIPIVLLNWFIVNNKDGFHGHIVPITGYSKENIYVNNPRRLKPKVNFQIERKKFLEAWESKGTDKDCVVIYRKN